MLEKNYKVHCSVNNIVSILLLSHVLKVVILILVLIPCFNIVLHN